MTAPETGAAGHVLRGTMRLHVGLALAACATTHLVAGPGPVLWGVVAGAALGVANFAALVALGRRLTGAATRSRPFYAVLFALKLGVLLAAVALVLLRLPTSPVGFLLGISVLVPAVLLMQLHQALMPVEAAPSRREEMR